MLYLGIDQHAKQLTISLRNEQGGVILKRQVSTEPQRCSEFFTKLKDKADDDGYIAIVEVCGFNDWLLQMLWVNQHRLRSGVPVRGVRQVVIPSKFDAENQRITLLRVS